VQCIGYAAVTALAKLLAYPLRMHRFAMDTRFDSRARDYPVDRAHEETKQ
jgi:hypothetical protein